MKNAAKKLQFGLFLLVLLICGCPKARGQTVPATTVLNVQTGQYHIYTASGSDVVLGTTMSSNGTPTGTCTALFNDVDVTNNNFYFCGGDGAWHQVSGGSGSMTWPTGGAGIPNYGGSSAWGTSYNASNPIPANFISILNQSTTGNAATATAFATNPLLCGSGQAAQGIQANGNATGCITPLTNPMTTLGDLLYGGASGAATRLAGAAGPGIFIPTESPTSSTPVAPTLMQSGLNQRTLSASDTVSYTDVGNELDMPSSGPSSNYALALPTTTTLNNSAMYFRVCNRNTSFTRSRHASDKHNQWGEHLYCARRSVSNFSILLSRACERR